MAKIDKSKLSRNGSEHVIPRDLTMIFTYTSHKQERGLQSHFYGGEPRVPRGMAAADKKASIVHFNVCFFFTLQLEYHRIISK